MPSLSYLGALGFMNLGMNCIIDSIVQRSNSDGFIIYNARNKAYLTNI